MFVCQLLVESVSAEGAATPCPVKWIDSFCMRNFTNDAVFDDTLPTGDGRMEAGLRVPLDLLRQRMEGWFRTKGYLPPGSTLRLLPA